LIELNTRYGALQVPNTSTDVIGRFLASYGEWAWDEVVFVASVLGEGQARVLDLGAFIGTFGLGLSLARQLDFVCFVEANSDLIPLLTANVSRNCRAPNAVLEALVIGPNIQPTEGRYAFDNLGSTSFTSVSDPAGSCRAVVPLPGRKLSLADIRSEFGDFDLVKLDVEGMELDILRGDSDHLANGGTTLWLECNETPQSLETAEYLLSLGLSLYYFAFPSHNLDNFRGDPVPIFPFAYEAGLLAAPRSTPKLDERLSRRQCILRPISNLGDLKSVMWRTPRWGLLEWLDAPAEELAALAGRSMRGESFQQYLMPSWSPSGAPLDVVKRQLDETRIELAAVAQARISDQERAGRAETELARIGVLLKSHSDEIAIERARADRVESVLAQTSAQLLNRLSETGVERERAEQAEAALHVALPRISELEQHAAELERRIAEITIRCEAIESSLGWRTEASVRRLFGAQRPGAGAKPNVAAN